MYIEITSKIFVILLPINPPTTKSGNPFIIPKMLEASSGKDVPNEIKTKAITNWDTPKEFANLPEYLIRNSDPDKSKIRPEAKNMKFNIYISQCFYSCLAWKPSFEAFFIKINQSKV